MSNIETIDDLHQMHWFAFEKLCANLVIQKGCTKAHPTSKGIKGGDDGIDLLIEKNGEQIIGQCKRWTKNHGLINVIRELGGSLKKRNLEHGMFFVTIKANKYEREEASAYGIELWDAYDILACIHHANINSRVYAVKNIDNTFKTDVNDTTNHSTFKKVIVGTAKVLSKVCLFVVMIIVGLILEALEEVFAQKSKPKKYRRRSHRKRYSY